MKVALRILLVRALMGIVAAAALYFLHPGMLPKPEHAQAVNATTQQINRGPGGPPPRARRPPPTPCSNAAWPAREATRRWAAVRRWH